MVLHVILIPLIIDVPPVIESMLTLKLPLFPVTFCFTHESAVVIFFSFSYSSFLLETQRESVDGLTCLINFSLGEVS